ncbi:MAG: HEPN domain-containing protein [Candidatus Latescibacteria bacterium]|jgi:HEPN domain-containing protein|nr:HEPN domain-containing protein [Candidatus Latescibacterota bacterium]MBT5832409.1 HEPN domain-containing protein [Candidatus Latescibacterota bacterium]
MLPQNFNPGSPEEWLARSKSNLVRARNIPDEPGFLLEDACFDAQQSVEKALKAIFVHLKVPFPFTHNLGTLLNLLSESISISEDIKQAARLTEYAVETRYPPSIEKVSQEEYQEALDIAERVFSWAMTIIS